MLIAVARLIRENLRKGEIVCRLGGDEFAVLLPGSGTSQGERIARRMQDKVVSGSFKTDADSFSVTASFGIAEISPENPVSLESLLHRADQAMYKAKRSGRNCVSMYAYSRHSPAGGGNRNESAP